MNQNEFDIEDVNESQQNIGETLSFVVDSTEENKRIDVFLSEKTEKTRSLIQKLLDDGFISVNGKSKKKNYKIIAGDIISLTFPLPRDTEILPEKKSED